MSDQVDEIYDRLVHREDLKNGTKYERLAGIVFRKLMERETVHDVRLRGASDVKHQIDVVVGDSRRRILIETKDHDGKVGLGVVRDFRSVVEELRPDAAFVVSREGFTRDAVKYAEAKGLRLAVLRPVDRARGDLDDRYQAVVLDLIITRPVGDPRLQIQVPPAVPDDALGRTRVRGDDAAIESLGAEVRTVRRAVLEAMAPHPPEHGFTGTTSGLLELPSGSVLVFPDGKRIPILGCRWEQDWVTPPPERIEVREAVGGLAAELIFRTLDGEIDEVFTNHSLMRWTYAEDGTVVGRLSARDGSTTRRVEARRGSRGHRSRGPDGGCATTANDVAARRLVCSA